MDHNNVELNVSGESGENEEFDAYITENGKRYRVPYRIIKKAVFSGIRKEDLIDIPHAARLQYRLMLMDQIIKATVDFTKCKITILYNPKEASNNREKISIDEIKEFLAKQGVGVNNEKAVISDFDYYRDLYTYAYTPPSIRERTPYGYTPEMWKKMKPEWEQKMKQGEVDKKVKFRNFQESYLDSNPDVVPFVEPDYKPKEAKKGFFARLFGGKEEKKEKGFWFHGV